MFLKRVLRDSWNFTGVVTSDSGAIDEIFCKLQDCRKIGGDQGHEYRNWTAEEATAAAIKAGCDVDSGTCISSDPDGWSVYAYHTASAVNQSLLTWAEVDEALRHAFTLRFKLGLLDPIASQPFWHFGKEVVGSDEHRNLSARASERSLVLLSNTLDALPLKRGLRLDLVDQARWFLRFSLLLYPFGSKNGGLAVWVTGRDHEGRPRERRMAIVTEDDGPATPSAPAILLARKLLKGELDGAGAAPCMGLLALEELMAHLNPLGVHCLRGDEGGWETELVAGVPAEAAP